MTDSHASAAPLLLLGGRGKTGRRVAGRLQERGLPVRIGGRSTLPPFDWQDRSTWPAALDGARAAYITYYPDISVPGALEDVTAFVDLALGHRVSRLVLLTGRGEDAAQRAEEVLMRSGAEWTVVRASWFMQNFSENFFIDDIRAGKVVFPADSVLEPFVDADDIAEIVVKALVEDGHGGKLYEVTGPRLMTFADAVAEIGSLVDREIRYVPVTVEGYLKLMRELDVPADHVQLLEYLTREVLDGRNESLADGVHQALGRPPRDFSDFARSAAAAGFWTGEG